MDDRISLDFGHRPSVPKYMFQAFLNSPRLKPAKAVSNIDASWRNTRIDPGFTRKFFLLCGMKESGSVPILLPQVMGFPLLMATLTHPRFPLPIWKGLQIRNRLIYHNPVHIGERVQFNVSLTDQRTLNKGIELDLTMKMNSERGLAWESCTTMFYRGNFGTAGKSSIFADPPLVKATPQSAWTMPTGGGLRFGHLSGDYNGIHWWGIYAKILGFHKPFLHPHRVVGQMIARMNLNLEAPQRINLWYRGPVPYGARVQLANETKTTGCFSLFLQDGDRRPCIMGCQTHNIL